MAQVDPVVDDIIFEAKSLAQKVHEAARKGYVTPGLDSEIEAARERFSRRPEVLLLKPAEGRFLLKSVEELLRPAIDAFRETRLKQERDRFELERRRQERAELRKMLDHGDAVRDEYTADDIE